MVRIVSRIDQAANQDYDVIRLEHASASEIVKIVGALNQGAQQADGGGGPRVTVVADERTNSVLVTGDENVRLRYRALITHLDTPLEEGGDTQVRYLRYTAAVDLATKLQSQYSGISAQAGGGKDAAPPAQRGEISIWADENTNALVITAPPKIMKSMMAVIDRLDIRRAQVLVEAVIVEVTSDKAAELGVTWAVGDKDLSRAVGVTKFDNTVGVAGIAGAVVGGGSSGSSGSTAASPTSVLGSGLTLGIGKLRDSGLSFVALIEALEADGSSISSAHPYWSRWITKRRNQGWPGSALRHWSVHQYRCDRRQYVRESLPDHPARAGRAHFKTDSADQRGNAVRLKVQQEISSILPSSQAVDLITSNRSINTSVIVEDGGTLVLGGLIQDQVTERQQRVPILGRIPILGALFRSDQTTKTKTNLMVFIKPTILRDNVQAAFETNAKYNYIRDQQLAIRPQNPRLMPLTNRPSLPDILQPAEAPDTQTPPAPETAAPDAAVPDPATPDETTIDLRKIPDTAPVGPAKGPPSESSGP
ncbi:MAG: secretin N-terminal domain-containing protein [Gammaproteobacteria bacterium]